MKFDCWSDSIACTSVERLKQSYDGVGGIQIWRLLERQKSQQKNPLGGELLLSGVSYGAKKLSANCLPVLRLLTTKCTLVIVGDADAPGHRPFYASFIR